MPRPMESGSNGSRYMYPTYLVICMGISCFGRYASYTIPMDPMNGMFLQFLPPNTRGFLDAVSLYQQHHGNVRPKTLVNRRQGSTVNESKPSLDLNNKRRTTQLITFTNTEVDLEKMAAPCDLQNHLWLTTPSNKVVGDQQLAQINQGEILTIAWCLPITSTTGLLGGGVLARKLTNKNTVSTNYCEKYGL